MGKNVQTIIINDYSYQVNVVGEGQPTWVFLHGFLGSQQEFSEIRPIGTSVYVTLKGFGPNAPLVTTEDLLVKNQIQDIKQLLEELKMTKVNLVGYSMGARLALSYAITFPDTLNQLVLESGTAGLANEADRNARQTKDELLAQELMEQGMTSFVDMWEALPLFATQHNVSSSQQQAVRQQRLNQESTNMAASLRAFGTGSMPNYWPVLGRLDVPTTIITGERDEKFTAIGRLLSAHIEDSRQIVVPGTGHNVHLEAVEIFTKTLNQLV